MSQLLCTDQLRISSFSLHQLLVISQLYDTAILYYSNPVGVADGGKAMGNDHGSAPPGELFKVS